MGRSLFQWQYSGVAIPFLWGAGIAAIAIGLALDDPDAIHDAFITAYAALVVGCAFWIGFWTHVRFHRAACA
jgi:hypothetical protein